VSNRAVYQHGSALDDANIDCDCRL
jgi:hypothetical protein